jgi:hypothetical protein
MLGLLAGGPIEGRLLVLSRDLTLESEVLAVAVVGVVVRGVEAAELAEDGRCLLGDLVGDYSTRLEIITANDWPRNLHAMTIVTQGLTQFQLDSAYCVPYLLQCRLKAWAWWWPG